MEFIFVGIGGFLGSCLRYFINSCFQRAAVSLPFGTLISNIIAGLLIGFIVGIEQQSLNFSPKVKLFLTTGLLGGLSTFSTFSLETVEIFQKGKFVIAALNVLLNLSLSFLGVVLGMTTAKFIMNKA